MRQNRVGFRRRGMFFTLVEMLVVVAIIGILAALLMPSLQSALETALTASCTNNLKQVYMATGMYRDEYNGYVPAARGPGWQVCLSRYTPTPCASLGSKLFLGSIFDCPQTKGWESATGSGEKSLYRNYGMNYRSAPLGSGWQQQLITPVRIASLSKPARVRYIADATSDILDTGSWYWDSRHMKEERGNLLVYDGQVQSLISVVYYNVPVK